MRKYKQLLNYNIELTLMMKKTNISYLILFIGFILLSVIYGCSQKKNKVLQSKKTSTNDHLANIDIPFKLSTHLVGTWVSIGEYKNGKKVKEEGGHTLILKADSTYESLYKPNNLKRGRWLLIADTIIRLQMKVLDDYLIEDISDSTLKTQLLYLEPDKYVIEYKKQ
ncbi:hypothetical protein [Flammeovirga sp. SJP92]|uniref:hypothetical protein n=1 Tax=Flammeovirga sp. SJP92 TaxID=1775430 RepID=UPI000791E727|nr:hypothetical protein [Flammeovirga sp. SJP92]KXX66490.1 hypothetical protein AVL50_31685 [Flammeovirga sp. SJP92]